MNKNHFKIVLLILSISIFNACSSDEEEENLSFSIQNNERFAPSEINTINNTTNHLGTYTWEIEHHGITETFNTEDMNFTATKSGEYSIKLTSSLGNETEIQNVTIEKPSALILNKVKLKEVPQNYNDLYFKIRKYERINGNLTDVGFIYTSPTRQNINSGLVGFTEYDWNVGNSILLTSDALNLDAYIIEFYTGNDILVTKIKQFHNSDYGLNLNNDFEIENDTMITGAYCNGCDYFEIYLDYEYSDY